jgi:hypothetical protein
MDSTEDVLSKQSWGRRYHERRNGWTLGYRKYTFKINAQFKLLSDNNKCYWKRGDIIKFDCGYFNWKFDYKYPWKRWFLNPEDYLLEIQKSSAARDLRVPLYARSQYALMVSRYKWVKVKPTKTYTDYGSVILMLTGLKAGKMRRYYTKTPFSLVTRYPYDEITPRVIKEIPELRRIQESMNYSKDVDNFILNIITSFNDANYPQNMEEMNGNPTNFRYL